MKNTMFFLSALILSALAFSSCVKDEPVAPPVVGDSPIKINEVYSNGGRSTYGAIDWVELYNTSDQAVDISGYVLYDNTAKSTVITVPAGTTLPAHGLIVVEVDTPEGFGLSSNGEMIYLDDASGQLIDNVEFPALTPEQSYARVPDGTETFAIQTPTPNAANSEAPPALSPIKINEVYSNGGRSFYGAIDWVELYNTSNQAIDISGYVLYDNTAKPAVITVPAGTTLPAHGFIVVEVDTPEGFGLSSGGETVYLDDAHGNLLDQVTFPALGIDESYSRVPDGSDNWVAQTPTANATNAGITPPVDYTQLVINEIDGNGKFVEIFNKGTVAISLENITLFKNDATLWWTGGAGVTIAAGGYYAIAQAGGDAAASEMTGNGGISPKKTVKFEMFAPDGLTSLDAYARVKADNVLDANCAPDYGSVTTKYSFSRCPDGIGAFELAVPSCNAANTTSEGAIETN